MTAFFVIFSAAIADMVIMMNQRVQHNIHLFPGLAICCILTLNLRGHLNVKHPGSPHKTRGNYIIAKGKAVANYSAIWGAPLTRGHAGGLFPLPLFLIVYKYNYLKALRNTAIFEDKYDYGVDERGRRSCAVTCCWRGLWPAMD